MLKELNISNFEEEIKSGLKLIEFYTTWCGYCKKQLSELKMMDKIWIGQIDAEKESEISNKYKVNSFPTFIIFKQGKEVEKFSGYLKKEDLMNKIMRHLN